MYEEMNAGQTGDTSEEDEEEPKEPPAEPTRFGWVQGVMVGTEKQRTKSVMGVYDKFHTEVCIRKVPMGIIRLYQTSKNKTRKMEL